MRWDNNLILASFVILVVIEIFYLPCMWLPTKQNRYFRALLVATLVIYLELQNPSLYITSTVDCFNRKTLSELIEDFRARQRSCSYIGISLNSFEDLRAIYGDAAMSEALHSVVTFLKKDACPSIACYVNAGHFVLLVKPRISVDTEVKHITALVDSYGISHEMIELEITETTTIDLLLGA